MRAGAVLAVMVALGGCAAMRGHVAPDAAPPAAPDPGPEFRAAAPATPAAAAQPPTLRPPQGARTAAALDTTTPAERAAAVAPAAAPGRVLGRTTAALGDPTVAGFWLSTPLVAAPTPGRVRHGSGASVAVELRPSGGAPGSGSRLSLAAFRALGLALTDLPELEVAAD